MLAMSAKALRAKAYHFYRARLELIVHIPSRATDQDIHEMIRVGFPTSSLESFLEYCGAGLLDFSGFISPVLPDENAPGGQRLSTIDGAHLFRIAHIVALSEVIFGSDDKARRWLTAPKESFSRATPIAMLSTVQGAQAVEQMLIRAVEGNYF